MIALHILPDDCCIYIYIYIYVGKILLFGVKTKLSTLSGMSPCYFAIAHAH